MDEEIRKALDDINNWYIDECQKAAENAREHGTWVNALDGNRKLFEPIKAEKDRKVRALLKNIQK